MLIIIFFYIVPPTVQTFGPGSVLGVVGLTVTLSFNITNDSPQVTEDGIRWIFNNGITTTDITGLSGRFSFSDDLQSLTIIGIGASDEGNYTLVATNSAGSNRAVIDLQVEGIYSIHNTFY